jgi:hypothetical protein
MQVAEAGAAHIPRQERPHLAQEYRDRKAYEDADSITVYLLPHARMCAKGEMTPKSTLKYRHRMRKAA